MIDHLKNPSPSLFFTYFFDQHPADPKMDRFSFFSGNQIVSSLLHPIMKKFVVIY